jgi:hypothetical protein
VGTRSNARVAGEEVTAELGRLSESYQRILSDFAVREGDEGSEPVNGAGDVAEGGDEDFVAPGASGGRGRRGGRARVAAGRRKRQRGREGEKEVSEHTSEYLNNWKCTATYSGT